MSDYIPEQVVQQILRRLPPKSLVRFRCVSKSWNLIISSSDFISMHTQQTILSENSTLPQRLLIRHYSRTQKKELYSVHLSNEGLTVDSDTKVEFPFHNLSRYYFRIVGSCNGVLCLSDDLFGYTNTILLWNPSIRRKITLPMPNANQKEPYMLALGFGFDPENLDLKVVRIAYVQGVYGYLVPPKVDVYTLSTGNWREISSNSVPQNCIVEYFYTQAFVNGKVHWINYKRNEESHGRVENLIMVFDMKDEVFDEMFLPNHLANESPMNMCTVVFSNASLAVLQYNSRVSSNSCSMWVMKEYGVTESWTKQFNITVKEGLGMVLGFIDNGHVLFTSASGELLSYDTESQTVVKQGIFGTKDSFSVNTYRESLALLNEGREANERTKNESDSDSSEDDDDDDEVETHEFWMQSIMFQYLTAVLGH